MVCSDLGAHMVSHTNPHMRAHTDLTLPQDHPDMPASKGAGKPREVMSAPPHTQL